MLLFQTYSDTTGFLETSMTGLVGGDWINWVTVKKFYYIIPLTADQGKTSSDFFASSQWVFLALATNFTSNFKREFRNTLSSTTVTTLEFENRTADSTFYLLSQSAKIYIGGDPFYTPSPATFQYVQLYIDCFPNSPDEMTDLAIMDPGIKFFQQINHHKGISTSFSLRLILQ